MSIAIGREGAVPAERPETAVEERSRVGESRMGPRLVRATTPFTHENVAHTWSLLAVTMMVVAALHVGVLVMDRVAPWAMLPLGVLTGLVYVRLFIFYHDFLHGALFRRQPLARWVLGGVGYLILAVTSVWQETHDYHHRHNARVIGSSIGSYPVVTVKMWMRMNATQRRQYRLTRNPVVMALGYLTVFMVGMSASPFRRSPKTHWQAPFAVLVHLAWIATWTVLFGWKAAVCAIVVPMFVACGLGSYLFYAQHNFPEVRYFERREWTFDQAALRSSSMFEMPRWMHWLTGNIGYHHIHHLNHRIPFYRLPEAYAAIPELQIPGRVSWRPSSIRACLALAVWDPERQKMMTWQELRAHAPETF